MSEPEISLRFVRFVRLEKFAYVCAVLRVKVKKVKFFLYVRRSRIIIDLYVIYICMKHYKLLERS